MRSRSAGGSAMLIHVPSVATERLSLRPLAPLYGRTKHPQQIARKAGPSLRSRRGAPEGVLERVLGGPLGRGDPRHVSH